jgi:hypothetical protein
MAESNHRKSKKAVAILLGNGKPAVFQNDGKERQMGVGGAEAAANPVVEPISAASRPLIVSDELARITTAVSAIAPQDADITFEYDGKLRINIDIRKLEDLAKVETLLPGLCGGIFSNLQRGLVENHPFLHRLTALVDR